MGARGRKCWPLGYPVPDGHTVQRSARGLKWVWLRACVRVSRGRSDADHALWPNVIFSLCCYGERRGAVQ